MLKSLLPIKLSRDDSAYKTVDELAEVLRHATRVGDIKNIALTGPFGSGKSSVLHTLMENHKEFHFLPISLATLQANQEDQEEKEKKEDKKVTPKEMTEEEMQFLNKKIEYSILQQIIYKETDEVVPNSRFRRIVHIDKNTRRKRTLFALAVILSGIILFFQDFTKSLLEKLHIEQLHTSLWLYIPAAIIFIAGAYYLLRYVVRTYANSKLNKLNLKDGEIGVVDDESIFNKHLDEILYFFQVSDYQVVVLEDLDRFETENIFLKLRELNQLINESKIVERPIVFIYAIKDDIFHDESRTKFFDYITTIIPVINPSNSKDKLRAALKERGFEDGEISDDDLSEMAFFIQDMRILTNIANEYSQYREKLYETSKKRLNLTKLLAMIVYKNYFPRDFARLHKRDGHVYECINSKQKLIPEALKVLDVQKKDLENTEKTYEENRHLKENDLRLLFLYGIKEALGRPILSIQLSNNSYSLEAISKDEKLFNELLSQEEVHYTAYIRNRSYGYYNEQATHSKVDFSAINKKMNFDERMALLKDGENTIARKIMNLQNERLNIQKLKLSVLIKRYNLGETQAYKALKLTPLMDVFIRLGYIDEDYYDYISYFYPEMLSEDDRDLLLSIKRQIKEKYDYPIKNIDNFVKELKDYMFDHDAILNNELLDYFARKKNGSKWKDKYMLMMMRLEREDSPLDFLSQYYQKGKQQKEVFSDFIEWDKNLSWNIIAAHQNQEEQQTLQEAWLCYCNESTINQTAWLNENYSFLSSRVDIIGLAQSHKLLSGCKFVTLDANSPALLDDVIKSSCYEINANNLYVILKHILKVDNITPDSISLTNITSTNNTDFINYLKRHFSETFKCLSGKSKDESKDTITYILNREDITAEQKIEYLTGQQQLIDNFDNIKEEHWAIAIQAKVVVPTWQNVSTYLAKKGTKAKEIIVYIEHYHKELESKCDNAIENKDTLFELLLGTDLLSVESFKSICNAFDNEFDGYEALGSIKIERLRILMQNNKIAFSEANVSIMQNTDIYADYLVHFSNEFISNLNYEYNLDAKTALTLLQSNVFTPQDKCKIIEIIDNKAIESSALLSEKIIEIVLKENYTSISVDKVPVLLKTAQDEERKVNFVVQRLSEKTSKDTPAIFFLLTLLGGDYKEVAERKKRPVFAGTDWNITLFARLKKLEYISSAPMEKGGIRVYPKRV